MTVNGVWSALDAQRTQVSSGALVETAAASLDPRVRTLLDDLTQADPSTEGHLRRVAILAVSLGQRLGVAEIALEQLALGGLLHDIGKLAVPAAILTKSGPLTDAEFALIRRHPAAGRALLERINNSSDLTLTLVESHHERLDGRGYPHGAPACRLPLEVRILSVADVFDALTAARVYRPAWSEFEALELLRRESGSAFDVQCVHALEEHLGSGEVGGEPLAGPRPGR